MIYDTTTRQATVEGRPFVLPAGSGSTWLPERAEVHGDRVLLYGLSPGYGYSWRVYDTSHEPAKDLTPFLIDGDAAKVVLYRDTLYVYTNMRWFLSTNQSSDEISDQFDRKLKESLANQEISLELVFQQMSKLMNEQSAIYDEDRPELWESRLDTIQVYELRGGTFELVPELCWNSPRAQREADRRAEMEVRRRQTMEHYMATDAMYQLVTKTHPNVTTYYQSQLDRLQGDHNPFYFQVNVHPGLRVSWGAAKGPLKAYYWSSREELELPRTPEVWGQLLQEASR